MMILAGLNYSGLQILNSKSSDFKSEETINYSFDISIK